MLPKVRSSCYLAIEVGACCYLPTDTISLKQPNYPLVPETSPPMPRGIMSLNTTCVNRMMRIVRDFVLKLFTEILFRNTNSASNTTFTYKECSLIMFITRLMTNSPRVLKKVIRVDMFYVKRRMCKKYLRIKTFKFFKLQITNVIARFARIGLSSFSCLD